MSGGAHITSLSTISIWHAEVVMWTARRSQFNIISFMAVVVACAFALAVERVVPGLIIVFGALAGSVLNVRRNGVGYIGGMIGGVVTGWCYLFARSIEDLCQGDAPSFPLTQRLESLFPVTAIGAFLGLAVGAVVSLIAMVPTLVRHIVTTPNYPQSRAERSATADPAPCSRAVHSQNTSVGASSRT
jgi:hypothetical protein